MINTKEKVNYITQLINIIKNNYKYIIYLFLSLFVILISFQYYFYQKEKNILKLSITYDNVINNLNYNDINEQLDLIAKEKGIYGILASLELIRRNIENNNFQYAYEQYVELLENNKSKKIYSSIIALHGSYNLIDYISVEEINLLLNYIDNKNISFQGYKNEIEYLLSLKANDMKRSQELFDIISNNENISVTIKERIKKINEFQKYQ